MMRDMTDKQFREALRRNGFKKQMMWAVHDDFPNTMFGMVIHPKTFKIAKRETVKKLLRDLDKARAEETEKCA